MEDFALSINSESASLELQRALINYGVKRLGKDTPDNEPGCFDMPFVFIAPNGTELTLNEPHFGYAYEPEEMEVRTDARAYAYRLRVLDELASESVFQQSKMVRSGEVMCEWLIDETDVIESEREQIEQKTAFPITDFSLFLYRRMWRDHAEMWNRRQARYN
jgi:hypothetical protein